MRVPLAVRVTHGPDGVACRLLGTGRRGPLRFDISLGQALAYADVGIHAIFLAS